MKTACCSVKYLWICLNLFLIYVNMVKALRINKSKHIVDFVSTVINIMHPLDRYQFWVGNIYVQVFN